MKKLEKFEDDVRVNLMMRKAHYEYLRRKAYDNDSSITFEVNRLLDAAIKSEEKE